MLSLIWSLSPLCLWRQGRIIIWSRLWIQDWPDFTPGGIFALGELHIIAVLFPAASLSGGNVSEIVSENRVIYHGVPQGSVLGLILFPLYINHIHLCIKHSSTYHFADDTNLLNINSNYKTLTKEINKHLKSLVWLTANKISLNNDNKIKLNGKRLILSHCLELIK